MIRSQFYRLVKSLPRDFSHLKLRSAGSEGVEVILLNSQFGEHARRTVPNLDWPELYRELRHRAVIWPTTDRKDGLRNRNPQILLMPEGDLEFQCQFKEQGVSRDNPDTVLLEDCGFRAGYFIDSLILAEELLQLRRLATAEKGLLLAETEPGAGVLDALRLLLSFRPETTFLPLAEQGRLSSLSQSIVEGGLGIIGFPLSNPFRVIAELPKELHSQALAFIQFRLLDKVCKGCRRPARPSSEALGKIPADLRALCPENYQFGRGCDECGHSSFKGKIAITSVLKIDRHLLASLRDPEAIEEAVQLAVVGGYRSLLEQGLQRISVGDTSFDQVLQMRFSYASSGTSSKQPAAASHNGNSLKLSPEEEQAPVDKTFTVLIVEDDQDHRLILEMMFKRQGYRVLGAGDGQDGLDALGQHDVDIVLCDVMMPRMNGADFVREVRKIKEHQKLPDLMLTAVDSPEAEFTLLDAGADGYCSKTVQKKILIKHVERLLSRT